MIACYFSERIELGERLWHCAVCWSVEDPSYVLSVNCTIGSIFTRGQFWPSGIVIAGVCLCVCACVCVCVCQPRACPCENSSPIQARTTKFGQKMQNILLKIPINLGVDR